MVLTINDPEVERLAKELANVRSSPVTESLALALREQLLRDRANFRMKPLSEILNGIRARMAAAPRYHADKTNEELIGYNEFGHFD